MHGIRRLVPLLAWLTALGVGIAVFHHLGAGALAPPPLLEPSQWSGWAAEREPLQVVIAVLRLVVLAIAWYLVGVTTIGLVARLSQVAGLVRLTDALTVPVVRRGLQAVLGLSLATAVVGAAVTVPVPHGPATTASVAAGTDGPGATPPEVVPAGVATHADPADPEVSDVPAMDRGSSEQAHDGVASDEVPDFADEFAPPDAASSGAAPDPLPLELLVPPEPTETPTGPTGPVVDPDAAAHADAAADADLVAGADADPPVATSASSGDPDPTPDPEPSAGPAGPPFGPGEQAYVVVPGDSLWLIAARTLEQHWSRAPLDAEVASYWQQVIDANRTRLADPEVPDLIFPDQELVLPAAPAPSGEDAGGVR